MSYQLILLGLLAGQPRHGYEIKQTFEEGTLGEYLKVSGGGLYYNLHKLVKEGYVTEQNIEREGNYPERQVYQITEEGRKFLVQLIGDTFGDVNGRKVFDPLDAALIFSTQLPKEAVMIRFKRQAAWKRGKLAQMKVLYESFMDVADQGLSEPYMLLLLDHTVTRLQNDLNWLESALEKIGNDPAFDRVHREKHQSIFSSYEVVPGDEVRTPENARKWAEYEGSLEKALQRYNQQADQAWREYEVSEKIFGGSPAQLAAARAEYHKKMEKSWQTYEDIIKKVRSEMEIWIKGVQAE